MPKNPRLSAPDDLPFQVDLRTRKSSEAAPNFRSLRKAKSGRSQLGNKKSVPIRGASAPATRTPQGLASRRVVVKARVIKMNAYGVGAAKLHLRYLDREGTARGEGREGFFEREKTGMEREELEAIREGEPHQFRLIVSPQDADRLDLTRYTRDLMEQVESDLGRKLDWKAINHYNTDNPHTHIVIHGLDQQGEAVFIDREYISNGIRNRASELATRELGLRMEHEITDSIQKEIHARKLTGMDRELVRKADQGRVVLEPIADHPAARLQRSRLLGRLTELERFGFVEKLPHQTWKLDPKLTRKLKQLEQFGAGMQRLRQAESRLRHPASGLRIHERGEVPPIEGLVLDRGFVDEVSERGYLVIGDRDGVLHQVETPNLANETVQVGHVVQVQSETRPAVRAADRNIAEYAALHGGQYRAEAHGDWAVGQGKVSSGKRDSYVQAHQLRLQSLSHRKLITPAAQDSWVIPADLETRLEQTAQEPSSQQRTVFRLQHHQELKAQTTYPGRSWLDEHYHALTDDERPFGVNVRLRAAAQARARWLQTQGLEPGTQASRMALDEMERKAVASRVGQQTGLAFRPLGRGESLQGELMGVMETPSLRRYAVVANSKEFSLVPWKKDSTLQKGKNMVIGVNQQGRAWAKSIQRGVSR